MTSVNQLINLAKNNVTYVYNKQNDYFSPSYSCKLIYCRAVYFIRHNKFIRSPRTLQNEDVQMCLLQ